MLTTIKYWLDNLRLHRVKEELYSLSLDPVVGVTGRVEDWLKDSESRYPISCTVLSVDDSMEGFEGIEYSWSYVSKALRYGAGVALDLSKLRPNGTDNGRGLVSSGATSFAGIYSVLNEVLRRGGVFKNGAVVVYLDALHPDLKEFLETDVGDWVKKAVYVSDSIASTDYIQNYPEIIELLLPYVKNGSIWLAKKRWYDPDLQKTVRYPTQHRLLSNVCMEILISSRSTCLLSHVNLGQCTLSNLSESFAKTMLFLCRLHNITGAGKDNYYKSPLEDRQVGMGVFGLANFLAKLNIRYKEFADALYDYMIHGCKFSHHHRENVKYVVQEFNNAFARAAEIARIYGMKRAFTVAPVATASYRYKDWDGYTTTPEISPPICHPLTKKTLRDSSTFGVQEYQYPPTVETAQEVGWDVYFKLAKAWQMLMDSTDLAHSISCNIWNSCNCDRDWFDEWLTSPLLTTYYRMMVEQDYVDKSTINSIVDDSLTLTGTQEAADFFIPVDDEDEGEDVTGFCPIGAKPGECSACAE